MSATRKDDSTTRQGVLYMALELSEKTWKLGLIEGDIESAGQNRHGVADERAAQERNSEPS